MKIRITNTIYGFNLTLPVEVNCERMNDLYMVKSSELVRVGGDLPDDGYEYAFIESEVDEVEPTEQTDTPCDVTNKCCNQFGERDEIQAIIDKLRADVAERDERIKELQRRLDDHAQL